MNTERKISSSILFAVWMLAVLLVFTAYNIMQYTLQNIEKTSAIQDNKNVELMLHAKYMEEILNEAHFIKEKKLFTSLAHTIVSQYSPKEKHSPTIQKLLNNAKEKGIYIYIFSHEGDKILSLTGKNDISTLRNLTLFTGKTDTLPPENTYSFLQMDPNSSIAQSFFLVPFKKYNSFLLFSKQHSLLDKTILTKEKYTHIRKKVLTSFSSSQYTLSFVNKDAIHTLTNTPLLLAIQNAKKNIPTYIQYGNNDTTLYATKYMPILQGYLIISKTLSPLISTLNNVLFTLLSITLILLLLYTLLIPLIVTVSFLPLKKSIEQFRIFSENFSTFSRIDIMAIQSTLPLLHKKGDLGNISLLFTKILHSLTKKIDSFVENNKTDDDTKNTLCMNIQNSFIPNLSQFKNNPHFILLVNTLSSSKIPNTFYDFALLTPKILYFTLGEFPEQSLKSVLWASTTLKILKGVMKHTYNPFESINALYTIMQGDTTHQCSHTLLTGFINLETGLVRYASMGIPKILHIESELSEQSSTVTTSQKSTSIYQDSIQLQSGDRIYLYNYTTHPEILQNMLIKHKDTFSKELFQMIISSEIAQKNITSQHHDMLNICIQFKEKENGTFAPIPTTIIGKETQDNIIRSEGIY
ncbi:MAG: SpoIIE family protein phosphatase [Desulfovibrionaceae bacterium]